MMLNIEDPTASDRSSEIIYSEADDCEYEIIKIKINNRNNNLLHKCIWCIKSFSTETTLAKHTQHIHKNNFKTKIVESHQNTNDVDHASLGLNENSESRILERSYETDAVGRVALNDENNPHSKTVESNPNINKISNEFVDLNGEDNSKSGNKSTDINEFIDSNGENNSLVEELNDEIDIEFGDRNGCESEPENAGTDLEFKSVDCGTKKFNVAVDKRKKRADALRCPHCSKKFGRKQSLANHVKIHASQPQQPPLFTDQKGSYVCGYCDVIFTRMQSLTNHLKMHSNSNTKSKIFKCPKCPKVFLKSERLSYHIMHHNDEEADIYDTTNKTFKCLKCPRAFARSQSLMNHTKLHNRLNHLNGVTVTTIKKELVTESGLLKCPKCPKTYSRPLELSRHLQKHDVSHIKNLIKTDAAGNLLCLLCADTFPDLETLTRHNSSHQPPYKCKVCSKEYASIMWFYSHVKYHTPMKTEDPYSGNHPKLSVYPCTVCGKLFHLKSSCEIHEATHTGERSHLCTVCGKRYPSARHLSIHMRIHSAVKPFLCPFCGRNIC